MKNNIIEEINNINNSDNTKKLKLFSKLTDFFHNLAVIYFFSTPIVSAILLYIVCAPFVFLLHFLSIIPVIIILEFISNSFNKKYSKYKNITNKDILDKINFEQLDKYYKNIINKLDYIYMEPNIKKIPIYYHISDLHSELNTFFINTKYRKVFEKDDFEINIYYNNKNITYYIKYSISSNKEKIIDEIINDFSNIIQRNSEDVVVLNYKNHLSILLNNKIHDIEKNIEKCEDNLIKIINNNEIDFSNKYYKEPQKSVLDKYISDDYTMRKQDEFINKRKSELTDYFSELILKFKQEKKDNSYEEFYNFIINNYCKKNAMSNFDKVIFNLFLKDVYEEYKNVVEIKKENISKNLKQKKYEINYQRGSKGLFYGYHNHCWNCKATIDSSQNLQCSCGWYICKSCGSCSPHCIENTKNF